jgi:hypothetical protein
MTHRTTRHGASSTIGGLGEHVFDDDGGPIAGVDSGMRWLVCGLVWTMGCSPRPEAATPTPGEPEVVAGPAEAATEPTAPTSESDEQPVGAPVRSRTTHTKKAWFVEVREDGSVVSDRFPDGRLVAGNELRLEGVDGACRLGADGTLRDRGEVFGRFVNDDTLQLDGGIEMEVASNGSVTGHLPGKGTTPNVFRVDAEDAVARREALFVLGCQGQMNSMLRPVAKGESSPVIEALAVGAGAAVVGYLMYRVMATDIEQHRRKQRKSKPTP